MAVIISNVAPGSLAAKKKIGAGDTLVSINGNQITDVLDYQFYITETVLRLVIKRKEDQHFCVLKIKKQQYEDIGLEFETYLMDQQRTCTNSCIFCFVDQMPPGMRDSLYFKDDDARLSFLFGNYITLTNLKQSEIDRIIKMKISPINISVHTTNPKLRCEMMHNRFAGEKLDYVRQLSKAGITINCQLVLCPGINDGEELKRTLSDLGSLYPNIQSVACVPVGLTKYREGLYPLERYHRETAREVIRIVGDFAEDFYQKHGTRLAYASDEFYIRAELPLPQDDFYEDFAQLENGVGVIAMLRTDFRDLMRELPEDGKARNVSIATGTDAAPFLAELVDEAKKKWHNLTCRIYPIRNDFFGETITVAGLVTAQDIIKQLQGKELGDVLILPNCMLRHEQDKFLDDYTVADVEQALAVRVKVTGTEGDEFLRGILEEVSE
ncbi:putative FeS-containing Cyanobacterial-specific oxidoreductase [uncultured Ruminococcus sp.]|nr:putative FeS-containing Cyanobacterial-specific oxidoreductase [uncultured Ruminococcus sp.]SCI11933.1 putative FeS-containing Cyanobacterial-specific oxidoreductase [uncultured Clostridium sp.]